MEDGGAIRTESRGLVSPAPTYFLKRLFVQSEAELRNFQGVPRVLHLAGIMKHRALSSADPALPHTDFPKKETERT